MKKQSRLRVVIAVLWSVSVVTACGAPEPTSTPLAPTLAPILPTATAKPTPETALEPGTPELPPTPVIRKALYWGIPYLPDAGHEQKLAIYLPEDAAEKPSEKYPVLFLAHGYTMAKDGAPLLQVIQYANSRGFAAVTIDYRDGTKTGGAWPAHHDAACALAWVFANADDYGLDVDHMVGFGNSYGAILVADLAMADEPGFYLSECPNTLPAAKPFSGVVAFGAPTFGLAGPDVTFATERVADLFEQLALFAGDSHDILALMQSISQVQPSEWATYGGFGEQETRMAQVWPVYWATPGDPPFLILTGDQDVDFWTLRDRVAFAELLQGLGVEATHVLLPFTGHTTFNKDASTWQAPLDEFLDHVLNNQ